MMRTALIIALLSSGFCFAVPGKGDGDFISLERTECFGSCPSYVVTVYRDGIIRYYGRSFVFVTGSRRSKISPASAEVLFEKAHSISFASLKDKYEAQMTDMPTITVALREGDQRKTVKDEYSGPKELKDLQDLIDEVAGTHRWSVISVEELKPRLNADDFRKHAEEFASEAISAGDESALTMIFDAAGEHKLRLNLSGLLFPAMNNSLIVEDLLRRGADPNDLPAGADTTPFMAAVLYGHSAESLRAEIKAGANVNGVQDGETMLMMAVTAARSDAVKVLLENGANSKAFDAHGFTATDLAQQRLQDLEKQVRECDAPQTASGQRLPESCSEVRNYVVQTREIIKSLEAAAR